MTKMYVMQVCILYFKRSWQIAKDFNIEGIFLLQEAFLLRLQHSRI